MKNPAEETPRDTLESCDLIRRSGFAIVETCIIRSALLNDGHVRLYANLASYCTGGRVIWPGLRQLALDLGKRADTISSQLAHLKKLGLVQKHWTGVRHQWMIQIPPPDSTFWRSVAGKVSTSQPAPDLGSNQNGVFGTDPNVHPGTVPAPSIAIQEDEESNGAGEATSTPSASADGQAAGGGGRSRRIRIPPESNQRIVRTLFARKHQDRVGQPYMPVHARDGKIWKRLLETYGLQRTEVLIDLFFSLDDERGYSVPGLLATVPRLLPKLSEEMRRRRRDRTTTDAVAAAPDRDDRWREARERRALKRGQTNREVASGETATQDRSEGNAETDSGSG